MSLGHFNLSADLGINITGDLNGNFLNAKADVNISDDLKACINLNTNSSVADYNFRLYQSDYINYNWHNNLNELSQKLNFRFNPKILGSLSADFNNIKNYLYFEDKGSGVKPYQYEGAINFCAIQI